MKWSPLVILRGGQLLIGINDKTGAINGLSFTELQQTTNLLSNMASENVVPSILIEIETVAVDDGGVVVVSIPEGKNKPYHDNKGIVWVKNGADKRKVFDNSELAEMMSDSGNFSPDCAAVSGASITDLDDETIKLYLLKRFEMACRALNLNGETIKNYTADQMVSFIAKGLNLEGLFRNIGLIRTDGLLSMGALLLFGKYPQRWLPVFTVKCVSFYGKELSGTEFRDKMDSPEIDGNILYQFNSVMSFFTRNLRKVQIEKEFNSLGTLEVPYESLTELVTNAFLHRSYTYQAPIRIFIFDDRIEIHSPGTLPKGLDVEDIKHGTSLPRNVLLFSNAIFLLPYTGIGSGIIRALQYDKNIMFENDENLHEFMITIHRKDNIKEEKSVRVSKKVSESTTKVSESEGKSVRVGGKSVKVSELTNKQKDVVQFCSIPRTSHEIMEHLGIAYHSKNITKYITNLVTHNFLKMMNSDPNASNQKYIKA